MLSQAEETALVGEDFQAREDLRKELFDNGEHLQTILEEGYKLKKFPEVYKKNGWSNLKVQQVNKVRRAWGEIDAANKEKILALARQRGQLQQNVSAQSSSRRPNITVHEKVRIMHLRVYPGAATIWSDYLGVKSRSVLDATNSHESSEREIATNPLGKLAEIFNDYEGFRPQNPVCMYNENGDKTALPRNSDLISSAVFDLLKGLDPNLSVGCSRDADFIKEAWMDIKKDITLVESGYHRSGNHKGDYQSKQGIDSWVLEFAADLYTKYAIVVLDQGLLCSLGKVLEHGCGRDTGILPGTSSAAEKLGLSTTNQVPEGKNGQLISAASAERKRRRHLQRERQATKEKEVKRTKPNEASTNDLAVEFNPQQLMALEILFKNSNGKFYAMAENALTSIAFGTDRGPNATEATPPFHAHENEHESDEEEDSEREGITVPFI